MMMNPTQFTTWIKDPNRRPLLMGVLNVTPDSFSDGGKFAQTETAIERVHQLARDGASIIDIGGESTRPGAESVPPDEQIRRVVPVIKAVAGKIDALISIDTTSAAVAEAALDAGANIVNDISAGLADDKLLPLVAQRRVPVILMHMQGVPATMQDAPTYSDVVAEVKTFLEDRIAVAQKLGIAKDQILVDPGIGFGKKVYHNLEVLRRQRELLGLGFPMVIGASRKGFIGKIAGEIVPAERLFGTAATVAWSVASGASIVRVHDVEQMSKVVRTISAIQNPQDFLTS
jgi:dihydropteroate synthase